MKKAKKRPALKSRICGALRRVWHSAEQRRDAMHAARIARGRYRCALCNGVFGPKSVHADHIEPVVDPNVGFKDWDTFIARLFCPTEGLQIICKGCHDAETAKQRLARSIAKAKK